LSGLIRSRLGSLVEAAVAELEAIGYPVRAKHDQ